MKLHVISLYQPWATLVVSGAKKIETRSWVPRELKVGERIAIHAAKRWTDEERALCEHDSFFKRYLTLAARRGLWDFDAPALGGVVGTAIFAGVERTDCLMRWITDTEHAFGNYGPRRFGWMLQDPQAINPPLRLRGQQGIFIWDMPTQEGSGTR